MMHWRELCDSSCIKIPPYLGSLLSTGGGYIYIPVSASGGVLTGVNEAMQSDAGLDFAKQWL